MDNNSQSSDIFYNSGDYSHDDSSVLSGQAMDITSYEDLVSSTKRLLNENVKKDSKNHSFSEHFSSVLESCSTCLLQSLDLVNGLLTEGGGTSQLSQYIDNAVNILQMLSNFIKTVVESVSMACCTMKTFPTTTGTIIMVVYTHCKDSETLYGNHIMSVERQLKDLFRNCHELQLTYLMVLEKNFIFDLTEYEELELLVKALDINLKIGKIVGTLDVKTMAVQWKAYTMICEKYAQNLKDKHIFQDCIRVLCGMIENNIRTAETNQEEKLIVRSLKVACFTLKILLKVCNIFKQATNKNYENILEVLLYTFSLSAPYLEVTGKSPQFLSHINSNVAIPSEILLRELLLEEKFVDCIKNIDISKMDKYQHLGYILIIISTIKIIVLSDIKNMKIIITDCVIKFLPYGHMWFNMNLKFHTQTKDGQTYGLYEHLLTHMFALVWSFNMEEINFIEQKMLQCLLSRDCYGAMFCSNLWELLAEYSSYDFLYSQVISLCEIYQNLENHNLFHRSPQYIHLSNTLSRLFDCQILSHKAKVYIKYPFEDERNMGLWTVLKIKNLPSDNKETSENIILGKLNNICEKIFVSGVQTMEDMDSLIKILRLGSTCHFKNNSNSVEDYVIELWMRLCCHVKTLSKNTYDDYTWYLEYIEALATLTISVEGVLRKDDNLVKILHVVSNMIKEGNTEHKLVLINLIGKIIQSSNNKKINSSLVDIVKSLLQDSEAVVINRTMNEMLKYGENRRIYDILDEVTKDDVNLRNIWSKSKVQLHADQLSAQLEKTMCLKYYHKCVQSPKDDVVCIELSGSTKASGTSRNFDLADIDTLFESESDTEPFPKKAKFESNDVEEILTRLEQDAALLYNVKENVSDYKGRIRNLCETLINIID